MKFTDITFDDMPRELKNSHRYPYYSAIHYGATSNIKNNLSTFMELKDLGYFQNKKTIEKINKKLNHASVCLRNTHANLIKSDKVYNKVKYAPAKSAFILGVFAAIFFFSNSLIFDKPATIVMTDNLVTSFLVAIASSFLVSIFLLVSYSFQIHKLIELEYDLTSISCVKGIEYVCNDINEIVSKEIIDNVLNNCYNDNPDSNYEYYENEDNEYEDDNYE